MIKIEIIRVLPCLEFLVAICVIFAPINFFKLGQIQTRGHGDLCIAVWCQEELGTVYGLEGRDRGPGVECLASLPLPPLQAFQVGSVWPVKL